MAYKKMILNRMVRKGFDIQKTGKCYFWYLEQTVSTLLKIERTFLKKF
jgi:hypothetical protein